MALWGAEVKPGEELVHSFSPSNGRLRITRATLGSQDNLGWSNVEASVGHETRATLCTLHPISKPMCGLELELEKDQDVTFSVSGQTSVHLSGYFTHAKAPTCTTAATRSTLSSKRTHQEMPDRNGRSKKSRIKDGRTCRGSDDHESDNQEWNPGNNKTNATPPPPPLRNKKRGTTVKKHSSATTSKIYHKKSDSEIHEISDDEKETTSQAKEEDMLTTEIIIEGPPDAKVARIGSKVKVKFVGRLRNGNVFDKEKSYQFRLGAGKMIHGWELGITGMLVGEERRITIPPSQGYGGVEQEKIPPNSWLIYTVKLLEVEQAKRTIKGSMHEKIN